MKVMASVPDRALEVGERGLEVRRCLQPRAAHVAVACSAWRYAARPVRTEPVPTLGELFDLDRLRDQLVGNAVCLR